MDEAGQLRLHRVHEYRVAPLPAVPDGVGETGLALVVMSLGELAEAEARAAVKRCLHAEAQALALEAEEEEAEADADAGFVDADGVEEGEGGGGDTGAGEEDEAAGAMEPDGPTGADADADADADGASSSSTTASSATGRGRPQQRRRREVVLPDDGLVEATAASVVTEAWRDAGGDLLRAALQVNDILFCNDRDCQLASIQGVDTGALGVLFLPMDGTCPAHEFPMRALADLCVGPRSILNRSSEGSEGDGDGDGAGDDAPSSAGAGTPSGCGAQTKRGREVLAAALRAVAGTLRVATEVSARDGWPAVCKKLGHLRLPLAALREQFGAALPLDASVEAEDKTVRARAVEMMLDLLRGCGFSSVEVPEGDDAADEPTPVLVPGGRDTSTHTHMQLCHMHEGTLVYLGQEIQYSILPSIKDDIAALEQDKQPELAITYETSLYRNRRYLEEVLRRESHLPPRGFIETMRARVRVAEAAGVDVGFAHRSFCVHKFGSHNALAICPGAHQMASGIAGGDERRVSGEIGELLTRGMEQAVARSYAVLGRVQGGHSRSINECRRLGLNNWGLPLTAADKRADAHSKNPPPRPPVNPPTVEQIKAAVDDQVMQYELLVQSLQARHKALDDAYDKIQKASPEQKVLDNKEADVFSNNLERLSKELDPENCHALVDPFAAYRPGGGMFGGGFGSGFGGGFGGGGDGFGDDYGDDNDPELQRILELSRQTATGGGGSPGGGGDENDAVLQRILAETAAAAGVTPGGGAASGGKVGTEINRVRRKKEKKADPKKDDDAPQPDGGSDDDDDEADDDDEEFARRAAGVCGLVNLSSVCGANSLLQTLYWLLPLREAVLRWRLTPEVKALIEIPKDDAAAATEPAASSSSEASSASAAAADGGKDDAAAAASADRDDNDDADVSSSPPAAEGGGGGGGGEGDAAAAATEASKRQEGAEASESGNADGEEDKGKDKDKAAAAAAARARRARAEADASAVAFLQRLQSLFAEMMLKDAAEGSLRVANPAKTVQALSKWHADASRAFALEHGAAEVPEVRDEAQMGKQVDAHELAQRFLSALQAAFGLSSREEKANKGEEEEEEGDEAATAAAAEETQKRNAALELFQGMYAEELLRPGADAAAEAAAASSTDKPMRVQREAFEMLTLTLAQDGPDSVHAALERYARSEIPEFRDEKNVEKHIWFTHCPPVLGLLAPRAQWDTVGGGAVKTAQRLDFPLNLSLHRYHDKFRAEATAAHADAAVIRSKLTDLKAGWSREQRRILAAGAAARDDSKRRAATMSGGGGGASTPTAGSSPAPASAASVAAALASSGGGAAAAASPPVASSSPAAAAAEAATASAGAAAPPSTVSSVAEALAVAAAFAEAEAEAGDASEDGTSAVAEAARDAATYLQKAAATSRDRALKHAQTVAELEDEIEETYAHMEEADDGERSLLRSSMTGPAVAEGRETADALFYGLHSVLVHAGGASAGHYWTYVRDPASADEDPEFFRCNDSVVTRVSRAELFRVLNNQHGAARAAAEADSVALSASGSVSLARSRGGGAAASAASSSSSSTAGQSVYNIPTAYCLFYMADVSRAMCMHLDHATLSDLIDADLRKELGGAGGGGGGGGASAAASSKKQD